MTAFGQLLRKYRYQSLDPLRGDMLTQERLGELLGHELGDAGYSGAAVSDWERGKSKIAVDDRFVLVSLITVLHKHGGIATLAQADELLKAGNYRALNSAERRQAFPGLPSEVPAAVENEVVEKRRFKNSLLRIAPRQENLYGRVSPSKRRKQLILLEKVRRFWIEGVLERSEQDAGHIELGFRRYDRAIDHPWSDVIGAAGHENQPETDKKKIIEIFQECDRSMLILGEPGAGKTTLLLDLARDLLFLAESNPAEAIPVILNLVSWTESRATIGDWVQEELTAKYQIPRRTGHKWLKRDELTLLLDGFDEIPPKWRESCAQELNRFRTRQGLTGIVVCSRIEEYEATGTQLKLGGAIALEPLTIQQVDSYLDAAGARLTMLRSAFRDDATLREMAQSPLMLNIMDMVYRNRPVVVNKNDGDSTREAGLAPSAAHQRKVARRRLLFDAYAQQMYQRRAERHKYGTEKTTGWLAWLAGEMLAHNRSVFLIEQMQPSWLPGRTWQWLYILAFGLTSGFFAGLVLWLFLLLLKQTTPDFLADLSAQVALILQMTHGQAEFVTLLTGNLLLGLLVAIIVGLHFERRRSWVVGAGHEIPLLRSQALIVGPVVGLLVAAVVALFSQPLLALSWGIAEALVYVISARYIYSWSFRNEIRTVEALGWSWSSAGKGLIIGLILAAIAESIGYLLNGSVTLKSVVPLGLGVFMLGGIQGRRVEEKSRPNQGIVLSMRNALIAGLAVALVVGPATSLVYDTTYAFLAMLLVFIVTASLYGGANVSKHIILRLLLWGRGCLPWKYAQFLDYAVGLAFLRKVGGGYIFMHRLSKEYFATLSNHSSFR